MTEKRTPTELLDGAYAIETPQDSLTYYQDFADHYDTEFAQKLGYIYPQIIARFFHDQARVSDYPIADIGCGTGLVAEALDVAPALIHGFDISPDMLQKSRDKSLYGGLFETDLTKPVQKPATPYGAVVSAGTFTHGHLGPDPIANLLTLARPKAFFCIGVNAQHYAAKGFAPFIKDLQITAKITEVRLENVPIFSDPNSPHGKDTAQVLTFRKS